MQQVNAVAYSADAQYIYSGSNDMNVRVWKNIAQQKVGIISKREANATQYRSALKEKFKYNSEIRKIAKHRHLPKYILNQKKRKQEQKESQNRKQKNMEVNNPDHEAPLPEKQRRVDQYVE